MRFLSKIRARQFAKKWGSTYNLSRAVLAGVLAAGCLMPGFAEAAIFNMDDGIVNVNYTQDENTANIINFDGINYTAEYVEIFWENEGAIVADRTIKVYGVNSNERLTITPDIIISGGWVADGNAKSNTVDISNVKFANSARIYGGFSNSDSGEYSAYGAAAFSSGDTSGDVTKNEVKISGNTKFDKFYSIYGGNSSSGNANENSVSISGTFCDSNYYFGVVCGGRSDSGEAKKNSVSISDDVTFGSYNINGFVYGGRSDSGEANYNKVSISSDTISGSTIRGVVYGGYSDSRNAKYNKVIISGDTINGDTINGYVYGGYSDSRNANENSVIISGGTFNGFGEGVVYGGFAYSNSGTANKNQVIISGGEFKDYVCGGWANSGSGTANKNQVIISGGEFKDYVLGGRSSSGEANDNEVILVGNNATYKFTDTQGTEHTLTGGKININGTVYSGLVYGSDSYNSTGNEIHVYGSGTEVGKIDGFNTLRFFIDDKMTFGETMLTIKGIDNDNTDVTISKDNLAVKVTGKPKASDDSTNNTITLIHNESANIKYSNDITKVPVEIGKLLTGEGSVDLVNNDKDLKDLVLTLNVEKTTVNENGKSLVETRAAAAFVVNNMSDFMLGTGMEQAKAAAGGVTPIDEGKLTPFAAIGGSNMRYTTGSYVDVNGWNGAVGFAKQADKLLFGVAVEHGRGNYDSYLDNGVHASGDIKSTGGVIFGEYKLDNGVHYDAALRAGRVKSDYNSTATSYDESSAYYGFSLGGGKELTVSDKATLDVYGRYYFSHTNGSDVSVATGEEIDFDAVNSHRLRIGGRYTTTLTEKSKAYAGLAWQYEFGGDAKAAINGYSAPTPSLQGHSAIVEAGYKLNAGKNLTLDFNLNGAMGKQRGIGGGIGAQWMF